MKIRTVAFGKTQNIGNYENIKAYLEGQLEEGEEPEEAYRQLRGQVLKLLGEEEEAAELLKRKRDLEYSINELERKVRSLKASCQHLADKWQNAKNILLAHGVEVTEEIASLSNNDLIEF